MIAARCVTTLLLAAGLVAALASPADAQRPVPTNVCGDPVFDLDGTPVSYSRERLEACPQTEAVGAGSAAEVVRASSGFDKVVWSFPATGNQIGASGIVVAAPDGQPEIIVGAGFPIFGGDCYWYVLRMKSDQTGYEPAFTSEVYPAVIRRIAVSDVVGDDAQEIVVALGDGTVYLYDLRGNDRVGYVATGIDHLQSMRLSDLDGDGKAELVVTDRDDLFVLRGDGYLLSWLPGAGGSDLVVGQMDDDPSLEIAVTSGMVIDIDSWAVQWTWPDQFGQQVEVADIDGDGLDELIAAEYFAFVWSYDVDRGLPKWSIPIYKNYSIDAIWVGDIDGDAQPDLLVGQDQEAKILAFDTLTQAPKWEMFNPGSGVSRFAVGDPDNNGELDLLWGAGADSTAPDRLFVANISTLTIEWQHVELDPPFVGPSFGDVDGDGVPELVVATAESESAYESGRILVFDGQTLRLRAMHQPVDDWGQGAEIHHLILRNVDDDPALEIVVATGHYKQGLVAIYDFHGSSGSFTSAWTNATLPQEAPFHSVEVADVDLDGALEVVAGGGRADSGADGVFLYVYDLATGEEDWHSFQLGDYWSKVTEVAVLADGGGHPNILAMVDSGSIYVFDGVTREPLQILVGSFTSLELGRGTPRSFLAGDDSGTVTRFEKQLDGYSGVESRSFGTAGVKDTLELPNGRFAVATADSVTIFSSFAGPALWTTTTAAGEFSGGLAASPLDEDLLFYCAPHALLAADPNQAPPRRGGQRIGTTTP